MILSWIIINRVSVYTKKKNRTILVLIGHVQNIHNSNIPGKSAQELVALSLDLNKKPLINLVVFANLGNPPTEETDKRNNLVKFLKGEDALKAKIVDSAIHMPYYFVYLI